MGDADVTRREFMAETEVGAAAARYFADLGFATFNEVLTERGGRRFDLVATRGALVVVVECKLRLSWDIIEQGVEARHYAHRVYLAVPEARVLRHRGVAEMLAATGLGLLVAHRDGGDPYMRERRAAAWRRRPKHAAALRASLCDEMNEGTVPGQNGGGYWTPFRSTMRAVERVLRDAGCELTTRETLDRVIAHGGHHYASDSTARSCLVSYAFNAGGVLDGTGIVARRDGTRILWSHAEPGPLGRCDSPNCSLFAAAACSRCGEKTCARCSHSVCRCSTCQMERATSECGTCRGPVCADCLRSWYGESPRHTKTCAPSHDSGGDPMKENACG